MRFTEARKLFDLDPSLAYFNWMIYSSHPQPVRREIERLRDALDRQGARFVFQNFDELDRQVSEQAALHLGLEAKSGGDLVAQTESTSMGLVLLLAGLRLEHGDEVLTTEHEFFVVGETLRARDRRSGLRHRTIRLYEEPATASAEEIVAALKREIRDETRLLTLTWVHSRTGVKLPIKAIRRLLDNVNTGRPENRRVLLLLDAVHGYGVENVGFEDLGCDFFVAGTHKWIFGPRGTGIVCARREVWPLVDPAIPSFMPGTEPGSLHTRGGVHAYEHRWAAAEALRFHRKELGLARVQRRTRQLTGHLKSELARRRAVHLVTPLDPGLSSAIVCFDLKGVDGRKAAYGSLREAGVEVSATHGHVRFSVSALNRKSEIDRALEAIDEIVGT